MATHWCFDVFCKKIQIGETIYESDDFQIWVNEDGKDPKGFEMEQTFVAPKWPMVCHQHWLPQVSAVAFFGQTTNTFDY